MATEPPDRPDKIEPAAPPEIVPPQPDETPDRPAETPSPQPDIEQPGVPPEETPPLE
ncbi:MAG: hypothetical protein AAGL68_10900 [Pseudomonadota bacterium]